MVLGALAVAAFVSLLTGTITYGWDGIVEGFSIYAGIILIVSFTAINDYFKDKNLVKLASDVKRDKIGVIRGKKGVTQTISIYQLVVGDVILIEPGCMVPADCVLIDGEGIETNETRILEDRTNIAKETLTEYNKARYPNPFLMASTFVNVGSGRAVVCCVGKDSTRGSLDDKIDTDSKTKLQERLDNLSTICTKYAIITSMIIAGAFLLNLTIKVIFDEVFRSNVDHIFDLLARYFTMFITVIIVAVPEGLPMAISLSIAYSVQRMKKDGILLKDLTAPEKMGQVDEILVGKTGTLTTGDLKVTEFYVQGKTIKSKRPNTLFNIDLSEDVLSLITNSIVNNCDARIEMDHKAFYKPVGNNTDVALLSFLQAAEIPAHDLIREKVGNVAY